VIPPAPDEKLDWVSMKILVINSGSSSIKYQLIDMDSEQPLAAGLLERIGEEKSTLTHRRLPGSERASSTVREAPVKDHQIGMRQIIDLLTSGEGAVIDDASAISAVGHRVVHGGEGFQESVIIDDTVIAAIEKTIPLAPLHNPANLMGIRVMRALFPNTPQVAVFDTAFHQSIPPYAYHYALPYEYYEQLGIRRYGFHGTSHQYVAGEAARLLGKAVTEVNLITAHLGSGASICAIEKGRSIDTSMGMTPLGGVIMGTRGGNIDPGVLTVICDRKGLAFDQLERILQKESGLKGICGSNDMRDIHRRAAAGDRRAQLALDMFVYRSKQYIGAYFFELGRVDALIFTAGIGEHDAWIRERICARMDYFGLVLDAKRNRRSGEAAVEISQPQSRVKAFVVPTNEELAIARQTLNVLEPDIS
jgi:acetate kinase